MRIFDPWIGKQYWQDGINGVRVLFLGESHYGEVSDVHPGFTTEVVREWAQNYRAAYFTKIAKIILKMGAGEWISDQDRSNAWEKIAFYNYIQSILPRSRMRPSEEMWTEALPFFEMTIKELKPQVLVVLGVELNRRLPMMPSDIILCESIHPSSSSFTYGNTIENIHNAISCISEKGA